MKKIRINNDITVKWRVTTNGEAVSLEGRQLQLTVSNMYRRRLIEEFDVSGNIVTFVYPGADQRECGVYTAILQDTTEGMRTVDKVQAFELVRHSIDQSGADDSNITTEAVEIDADIEAGIEGKSAYEVAVRNGFSGTEAEWLASLKGDKGDAFMFSDFTAEQLAGLKGAKGDSLTFSDLTEEQKAQLKGDKGDAFAYSDFTPEQIASLKGDRGDDGGFLSIVSHADTDTTVTLEPNTEHHWSGTLTSLNVSFAPPMDTTKETEYRMCFKTGAAAPTVTFSGGIVFPYVPTFNADCYYDVSVSYNEQTGGYYGVYAEFEIQ
ncbi:MAG: hypothetical protein MSD82_12365 [Prevotella sp.]|nr:hypothetical protein [Prevotella sp.]